MVREQRSHMPHSTVKKEKISKINPLPSEPPPPHCHSSALGSPDHWTLDDFSFPAKPASLILPSPRPPEMLTGADTTMMFFQLFSLLWAALPLPILLHASCTRGSSTFRESPGGSSPWEKAQPYTLRTHQARVPVSRAGSHWSLQVPSQGPQVVLQGKHCTPSPLCCLEAEAQAPCTFFTSEDPKGSRLHRLDQRVFTIWETKAETF